MNNIPIFDSLTHPTLNGKWLNNIEKKATISNLTNLMNKSNIRWTFAVGMKGIGGYNIEKYFEMFGNNLNRFFPIAFLDFENKEIELIKEEIIKIKKMGFYGIKIHPRISNISLKDIKVEKAIKIAGKNNLPVLLCTYFYDNTEISADNNITSLQNLLFKSKDTKIILLHSLGVKLLELMEISKPYKNVLLDLSFTMCKYEGSSIDLDLKYIFNNYDRRICVGSDFPEFMPENLRDRFEYFSEGLSLEKKENIAYKNIASFICADLEVL